MLRIGIELIVGRKITGFDTPIGGDFRVFLCLAKVCRELGHEVYILVERNSTDEQFIDDGVHFEYYDRLWFHDEQLGDFEPFDVIFTHLNHMVTIVIPGLLYQPRLFYFTTGIPDDSAYDLSQSECILSYNRAAIEWIHLKTDFCGRLLLHYTPKFNVKKNPYHLIFASTELYSDIQPISAVRIGEKLHKLDSRYFMDFYYVPYWLWGIQDALEQKEKHVQPLEPFEKEHLKIAYELKEIIDDGVDGINFKPFSGWKDFQIELSKAGFFISTRPGNFSMSLYEAMSHGTIPVAADCNFFAMDSWLDLVSPNQYDHCGTELFENQYVKIVLRLRERWGHYSKIVKTMNPMDKITMSNVVKSLLGTE